MLFDEAPGVFEQAKSKLARADFELAHAKSELDLTGRELAPAANEFDSDLS